MSRTVTLGMRMVERDELPHWCEYARRWPWRARWPWYSYRSTHGSPPQWMRTNWHARERARFRQAIHHTADWDAFVGTPPNRIGQIYDWV